MLKEKLTEAINAKNNDVNTFVWKLARKSDGSQEEIRLVDATPEQLKAAGLGTNYAQNGFGIYPSDANGVPFTTAYIAVMGDPVTDLHEDMAAEQKALATYYHLINLTDDVDMIDVLRFLGEREIVHYQRFGEALMDVYDLNESQHVF